ncbi:MAG: YbjN domain-containing protein [Ornithinimicrobium sp.]
MSAAQVAALRAHLDALDITWEVGARSGETVLTLPGERKLKTVVSVTIRRRVVRLRAFVVRNPDENHEGVYAFLLRRNLRLPGISYAIDTSGDVYLVGQFLVEQIDQAFLDDVLGAVLTACDEPFNELLALGFLSAMRTEWAWRISRAEPTTNLEAFRHLLEKPATDEPAAGEPDRGEPASADSPLHGPD